MGTPARTPEGEPNWCPMCQMPVIIETSVVYKDATCPRCGSLMVSDGEMVRDLAPTAGGDTVDPRLTETWELVQKARGGDSDALNRLFERYYERVRRSVRARFDRRLREHLDSEDILPPAIARAFGLFDRFEMRHEGSFLHWLAEHAKQQIQDAADRESAIKRQAPGGKASNPDHLAVEECLEQMSPDHRMVIVLRHYDGLSWPEVAQRLGQTGSSVHELHRRALLELATMLRSRGVTPAQGEGAGSLAGRRTSAAGPAQSKARRRDWVVLLLCLGLIAIGGVIRLAFGVTPGSH